MMPSVNRSLKCIGLSSDDGVNSESQRLFQIRFLLLFQYICVCEYAQLFPQGNTCTAEVNGWASSREQHVNCLSIYISLYTCECSFPLCLSQINKNNQRLKCFLYKIVYRLYKSESSPVPSLPTLLANSSWIQA